jgi:hypothetical protein
LSLSILAIPHFIPQKELALVGLSWTLLD